MLKGLPIAELLSGPRQHLQAQAWTSTTLHEVLHKTGQSNGLSREQQAEDTRK